MAEPKVPKPLDPYETPPGRRPARPALTRPFGRFFPLPPIWLEGRFWLEMARLRCDPVFAGEKVPPGRRQPVLVLPGFMAGDWSTATLRWWLQRMGYAPHVSGIDFNFWRSETLIATAAERLEKIYRRRRTKVVLIGQSRGGVLAKVLADRHPDQVAFVVALGSPLADPWDVHPATMGWVQAARFVNFVRYRERATEERFLIDLEAPPKVPVLSIYSRTDGIVHWQVCRRDDVESIEVRSSHVGMGVNPDVYRILAERLAAPRQRRSA